MSVKMNVPKVRWEALTDWGCPLRRCQVIGSPRDFPKTKEEYVNWGDEDEDGARGARFRGEPLEPFTKPLA